MSTLIIDYGMGNLRSVQKAFERIGETAVISSDPHQVATAERVILPGVGAFRDAIEAIHRQDLASVIRDHIAADRPFLGICLGLQLLFDRSLEDGEHAGLGIIPGTVRRFQLPPEFKIPHMGWNQLQFSQQPVPPLLQGLPAQPWFYFVHSYHCVAESSAWVAATADYGGPFLAAVARGNVMATQFHPEKSQAAGMQLLRNFLEATRPAQV